VPKDAAASPRRECDLSPPVQAYLAARGYTVRAEVNGCDITAIDGYNLIVVELKQRFSTDLLIQAIDRQRVADTVYVAIPADAVGKDRYGKRWKGIEHLLKRLELGLILVHFAPDTDAPTAVEVVMHPLNEPKPRRKPALRRTILREIAGRQAGDYNVGGVTKRGILTAYREQCIFIACCLDRYGPQTPAALRARGTSPKVQNILFRNVYGWFERQERGVYALRAGVREDIAATYPGVAAFYGRKLDEAAHTAVTEVTDPL
jgi:hypothetical protein